MNYNKATEIPNTITVRVIDGFKEFNHDETELLCEVDDGEELVATLYEESEEYFAKDTKGRDVFVGYIDTKGTLILHDEFELIG